MNGYVLALALIAMVSFGGILWWGRAVMREHPIRAIAVICVAIIGGFVMWMDWRSSNVMASPGWCGQALQAERISAQNFGGLTACIDLFKMQVAALASDNHTRVLVEAACLLALIVIVIAGGRANLSGPGGIGGSFGPGSDPAEAAKAAATQVAGAAVEEAKEVKAAADTGTPQYDGPAMPEPKG